MTGAKTFQSDGNQLETAQVEVLGVVIDKLAGDERVIPHYSSEVFLGDLPRGTILPSCIYFDILFLGTEKRFRKGPHAFSPYLEHVFLRLRPQ